MPHDLLMFRFASRGAIAGQLLGEVVNKLNSRPWMGCEARTCRVVKLHVTSGSRGPANGYVVVRHRPYGWKIRRVKTDPRGRRLDQCGLPLPVGQEPVICELDVLDEVDFNRFEFGSQVQRQSLPE